MRWAFLCLVISACGPKAMTITIEEPSSLVVSYTSGHNLFPGRYPNVELRSDDDVLVRPAHEETWSVEAHHTTKYYVLRPGTYRLFEYRDPTIKTLRREPARLLANHGATSVLDPKSD